MSTPKSLALPEAAQLIRLPTKRSEIGAVHVPSTVAMTNGTALLIPGFTGSKEDFIHLFDPLARFGWNVVAIDLPGQQHSPGPDDDSFYALEEIANDVCDVIERFANTSVHVVGHSLGGLIAQIAARQSTVVSTLSLMCSGDGALPDDRHGPLPALVSILPDTPMADIWAIKESMDRANGWDPPSADVHAFVRDRFIAHNPYALRAMAHALISTDTVPDSPAELPVLVCYGVDDDAWPTHRQDAIAGRRGGLSVRIPDAGHSPAVDRPGYLAALLDSFWRNPAGFTLVDVGNDANVQSSVSLPAHPSASTVARRHVEMVAASESALVVVTELVANAVTHGKEPVALNVTVEEHRVRIVVSDGDPHTIPLEVAANDDDVHGRGLSLVASLSEAWGWHRHENGKAVWADVLLDQA